MGYKTGRVSSGNVLFIGLSILALLVFYSGNAGAFSPLFASNCASASCHPAPTPSTCDGCHAHGVHSSSAKNDFNLSATTDKDTYSPGETVTVTFTGGYMGGWIRAYLYDNVGLQVDISTGTNGKGGGAAFPITLTGAAPATAGTYTFTAAWYGNQYDLAQAQVGGITTFGPNWTPDSNNANHGEERVSTNSFTVTAGADTTAPTVSSTLPDNNATGVAVGSPVTATFNEAIDPATVTTASFLVQAGVDNVAGAVALNGTGTIATFTPSALLQNNTAYTATLTTVITDVSGNPLAADYVWTFTTSAAVAPSSSDDDDNWFGCAMSPSGGRNGGILGTYGFLLLLALGIALRKRVRRRKE